MPLLADVSEVICYAMKVISSLKISHPRKLGLKPGLDKRFGGRTPHSLGNPIEWKLDLVTVTTRFFGKAVPFILEGDRRHPTQIISRSKQSTGCHYDYVDYTVLLPSRLLTEFNHWISKYVGNVKVLSPLNFVR